MIFVERRRKLISASLNGRGAKAVVIQLSKWHHAIESGLRKLKEFKHIVSEALLTEARCLATDPAAVCQVTHASKAVAFAETIAAPHDSLRR